MSIKSEKPVWDKPDPTKTEDHLSKKKKASAKARAKAAGRPYPNLIDNMAVQKSEDVSKGLPSSLKRFSGKNEIGLPKFMDMPGVSDSKGLTQEALKHSYKNMRVINNFAGKNKLGKNPSAKVILEMIEKPKSTYKSSKVGKFDSPAWTRSAGKNPEGGLNAKGRASAKAQGHNLKPPVKSGNNPRRASFLARMSGNPGPEHKPNGEPTRLLLSLQKWGASSKADAKRKAAAMGNVNKGLPSIMRNGEYVPSDILRRMPRESLVAQKLRAHKAGKRAAIALARSKNSNLPESVKRELTHKFDGAVRVGQAEKTGFKKSWEVVSKVFPQRAILTQGTRKIRVMVHYEHSPTHWGIIHPSEGQRVAHKDHITFIPNKKPKSPGPDLFGEPLRKSMEYSVVMNQSRFGSSSGVGHSYELIEKGKSRKRKRGGVPVKYNPRKVFNDLANAEVANEAEEVLKPTVAPTPTPSAPSTPSKPRVKPKPKVAAVAEGRNWVKPVAVGAGLVGAGAASAYGYRKYKEHKANQPVGKSLVSLKYEVVKNYDEYGQPVADDKPNKLMGAGALGISAMGARKIKRSRNLETLAPAEHKVALSVLNANVAQSQGHADVVSAAQAKLAKRPSVGNQMKLNRVLSQQALGAKRLASQQKKVHGLQNVMHNVPTHKIKLRNSGEAMLLGGGALALASLKRSRNRQAGTQSPAMLTTDSGR